MPSIEEKEEAPAEEFFECPQCGARVPSIASSCPKCGVFFAEEGADMFQCPACNTLVSMDATSCPGCGAIFVESAEAASEEMVAPAAEPEKEELEPPVTTVEPPPHRAKPPKETVKEEEVKEKKIGFGLFKRKKKEEEPEEEEKEAVPGLAMPPEKPAPSPVETVKPAPKPVVAPAPIAPTPMPVRQAPHVAAPGEPDDKGKKLSRMVAEVRPLMTLAQDKGVDISESMRLIDETYAAGRERQLDKAIGLVQKSKALLMERINANLAETLIILKEDLKVAQELGGDVSRPSTYVQEIERAKRSGDAEAAYVYADKVGKELQPIIGRYQDSKKKLVSLKSLIADCELFIVDTKEARNLLLEGTRAFESKDFDRVDLLVKTANDRLNKFIPARMSEEMKKAKDQLLEAKMRNVNITPMITMLKSVTSLMKAGDYAQSLKEMRQFKEMIRKVS
jgi:ribosomal protein L40E/cellobiose-specific phosphotransferase system component IIA